MRTNPSIVGSLPTAIILCLVCALLGGCDSEGQRLQAFYTMSVGRAQGQGHAAAANAMRKAWYAKELTVQGALGLAHEKVEKQNDIAAATFALSVLEFVAQVEPDIKKDEVNDFLYMRLGTLAANSAAIVWKTEPRDFDFAGKLVFGGPATWQNDTYWMAHPEHDALASYILFEQGKGVEALDRLRSRPDTTVETEKAMKDIEIEMRNRKR